MHAKTVSFAGTYSGVCRQETYVLQANSVSFFECKTSLPDQAALNQQAQLTGLFYT
jgi:hypothetical protein